MKRLSIYVGSTFASVTVENGVTRQIAGPTIAEVIDALQPLDRGMVFEFCQAITEYVEEGRPQSLDSLQNRIAAV